MRLLLVEDKAEVVEVFKDFADGHGIELEVATNQSDALQIVASVEHEIDFVVCDLKIPTVNGAVDDEVDHGLLVLRRVIEQWPGVPVVVLSAFGTVDMIAAMLTEARQLDVYGTGQQVAMLRFSQKANLNSALSMVEAARAELEALDVIELTHATELDPKQKRTLRVFARRRHGRLVDYRSLSGGRSGARTGLATVRDEYGAQAAHVVAKITRHDRATEEQERYRVAIAGRLGAGTYADLNDAVVAGCCDTAGLFYAVADTYNEDLFSLIATDDERAAAAVRQLAVNSGPWLAGVPQTTKTWIKVQQTLIGDVAAGEVSAGSSVVSVPGDRPMQVVWATQHGDLHGANVLVDASGRPVLIDYGRAGPSPSVLDPLTLELSVLLQPASPYSNNVWPSVDDLDVWQDIDRYAAECPYPQFLKACRDWAHQVSAGERDIYATVSAYCMRNLQYDDVDTARTAALQRTAARLFLAS